MPHGLAAETCATSGGPSRVVVVHRRSARETTRDAVVDSSVTDEVAGVISPAIVEDTAIADWDEA